WVLHNWGDDECIRILKKCREAILENKGKVIIVEAVMDEKDERGHQTNKCEIDARHGDDGPYKHRKRKDLEGMGICS
ncbi:PREDICTED: (RS)-norcoclaurine, partial [Prunus dulcis]